MRSDRANAVDSSFMQGASASRSDQTTPAVAAPVFRAPIEADGAINFDDLMGELNSLSIAAQNHSRIANCGSAENHHGTSAIDFKSARGGANLNDSQTVQLSKQLPEFWVDSIPEPEGVSSTTASVADEYVQKLLEQYQQSEAVNKGTAGPAEEQRENSGVEAYEASTAYEKFGKRLARQPNQCVRLVAMKLCFA
jgi:hypothetical protein